LAVSLVVLQAQRIVAFHGRLAATGAEQFRAVQRIQPLIGRDPIALDVSSDLANQWAVYFLRDTPLKILGYRSYMALPHVVPLMDQADAPDLRAVKYVLSDDASHAVGDVVWHEGPYWLSRVPPRGAAFLERVSNPNGAEMVDGRSFYWVGAGDTTADVFATAAGTAVLSGRITRGPSLPDSPERHLLIGRMGQSGVPVTITTDGDQSLPVPVEIGENHVFIRPVDHPSTSIARDPRPLLLGLQGLHVSMSSAPPVTDQCSYSFTSGWYAAESDGLRWSDGTGRLTVRAQQAMDLVLGADLLSYVRPNVVSVLSNGRPVGSLTVDDPGWTFHAISPLSFHVDAGKSIVFVLSSRAAAVKQPPDPRKLAVALNHVTVTQAAQPAVCALVDGGGRR
jgi:hypothetical protein